MTAFGFANKLHIAVSVSYGCSGRKAANNVYIEIYAAGNQALIKLFYKPFSFLNGHTGCALARRNLALLLSCTQG